MKHFNSILLSTAIALAALVVSPLAIAEESAESSSGYLSFENLHQVAVATPLSPGLDDLARAQGAHWDNEEPRNVLTEAVYVKPVCDCNSSVKRGALTPFVEFLKAAARRPARRLTCGTFEGEASWYNLPGNRYFNGQRFDGSKNHAAHKTLPMGTVVTVSCPNGRKIDVTIVDDGPHVKGRIIDLVPAPADQCGIRSRGHAKVTIEVKCPVAKNTTPIRPRASRLPELDPETTLPETPSIPSAMTLDEEPLS